MIISSFTFIPNQGDGDLPKEVSFLTQQSEFRGVTNEMSYFSYENLKAQLDFFFLSLK